MIDEIKCKGCPLEGSPRSESVSSSSSPQIMVVVDVPSMSAFASGGLMSRASSRIIQKHFSANGFKRGDIVFVPQVRCPYDKDSVTTKEKTSIRKHCRLHLLDDIARYSPEAIVPMGTEAATQVFGKAVAISKVRGVSVKSTGLSPNVFPMLSPGFVSMYPQHEPTFAADCRALRKVLDGVESEERDYYVIDDLQFLIDMQPEVLFFDTETTGLSPYGKGTFNVRNYKTGVSDPDAIPHPAILTMQFSCGGGQAYFFTWDHPEAPIPMRKKDKIRGQLRRLLCNPNTRVVGQNAKFDALFMSVVEGIRYPIGGDTLMLATLIDENSQSRSQDSLVSLYVPERAGYADEFNANHDKSKMWQIPLSELVPYGCGDVDTGMLLHDVLYSMVSEDPLLLNNYYNVVIPGLNAFCSLEPVGMYVDFDALDAFEAQMVSTVEEQREELLSQVAPSILREHMDKDLSFTRDEFIRDILFRHRDGFRLKPVVFTSTTAKLKPSLRVPSVSSKEHLPYFFDTCPFTITLAQHMKDLRMLGTSIRGFKKKYIIDGKVRPSYSLHTTVTGRTSSERPNGQNFPSRGENATAYKRCFVAPPGYVVLQADYSQIELRIVADMANERTMIRAYTRNEDLHILTGTVVAGITREEYNLLGKRDKKEIRRNAKPVNFGFIYGMWYKKFGAYAKTQYGVEYTEEESKDIREKYFALYPELPKYHVKQIATANKYGFVRSYTGRIRHLPQVYSEEDYIKQEAGRQAINAPVQDFASEMGVMAIADVTESVEPEYLQPVAFVHDALYCYVPEQYAIWGAKTLKWFMENVDLLGRFGLVLKVPIVADVSIGYNFGDTFEMPTLSVDEEFDVSLLWDEEKQTGIILPEQLIPPLNGARTSPLYDSPGEI